MPLKDAFNSDAPARKVKVAAVQLNCQMDPVANRAHATEWIRKAAAQGAEMIYTPEYTNVMVHDEKDALKVLQPDDDTNMDIRHYRDLAKELGVWLGLGSMAVKISDDKLANRQFLINPAGDIVARYDKIHMFDVDLPDGNSFRESDTVQAGTEAIVAPTPFGKIGMNICYDLRFPEQQKAEALEGGATILTVPSAYTRASGMRTWETFLRARAGETGSYVIAPAQCGAYDNGASWGHTMIVDPDGLISAQAIDPDKPGIVMAELDPAKVEAARRSWPALKQTLKAKFNVQAAPGPAQTPSVAKPASAPEKRRPRFGV